jgi:hypothetical protein
VVSSAYNTTVGGWQQLTAPALTVPVNATVIALTILFDANLSATVYVDDAMLVVGSQPATYVPLPLADDLARCQRYYEVLVTGSANEFVGVGHAVSTTTAYFQRPFRVPKAVTPTLNISAASTFQLLGASGAGLPGTSLAASVPTAMGTGFIATVASGLVAGNATLLQAPSGTITAEANP